MNIKNTNTLPQNYQLYKTYDAENNKKQSTIESILSLVLIAGLYSAGQYFFQFPCLRISSNIQTIILIAGIGILSIVAYFSLHELIHGLFFKIFGSSKILLGFKPVHLYASCPNSYFNKSSYIIILLSPVLIFGIILAFLQGLVPPLWRQMIFVIQVINIAGAAGDYYFTLILLKSPADVLVNEKAPSIEIYSAELN